jgi:hypothetical protein
VNLRVAGLAIASLVCHRLSTATRSLSLVAQGVAMSVNRVVLRSKDVLVYKGMEVDKNILDAIIGTDKRLLWAFIRKEDGSIIAVPYTEEQVIWMSESDVRREQDVEI